MASRLIRYELRGPVAWVVLNRPEVLNALNADLVSELSLALTDAAADDAVRAVILTGEGRAFSTGGDLKAGQALREQFGPAAPIDRFLAPLQDVLRQVRALPKPVIAAVNGLCLAGGLEVVLCCDIVLASSDAVFGDPRAGKGLIPALGGVLGLMRAVGMYKAREMLLTARSYSAEEMRLAGLVSSVLPADQLRRRAQDLASEFAQRPPGAIARIKRMLTEEAEMHWEEAARFELAMTGEHLLSGSEVTQGLRAFNRR